MNLYELNAQIRALETEINARDDAWADDRIR